MAEVTRKKTNVGLVVLGLLVFVLGGAAGYLYYQYDQSQKELSKLQDPNYISSLQEQQVQDTLDNLSQIMLLPEENPTVATLVDVEALREENEAFYKNAQNGDKLVIYTEQAILYREEENKIINVAPVFIEPNQEQSGENQNTETPVGEEEVVDEDLDEYEDSETGMDEDMDSEMGTDTGTDEEVVY